MCKWIPEFSRSQSEKRRLTVASDHLLPLGDDLTSATDRWWGRGRAAGGPSETSRRMKGETVWGRWSWQGFHSAASAPSLLSVWKPHSMGQQIRETLEKENKPFLYGCARRTRSKQPATLCKAWNDWKVRGERRGRDIIVGRPRGCSKAGWCGRKSLFFNLRINSLASPEKRDIKNTVKHLDLHRLANSNENITRCRWIKMVGLKVQCVKFVTIY